MADKLCRNARLNNPLPPDTDFSEEESKELQTLLNALAILPSPELDCICLAFSAKYLTRLDSSLRPLKRETQRKAISTYIQILSLLPDPTDNPYLGKFLQSPNAAGLPNLVASNFVQGIDWLRPSGPGHICTLLIHFLFWCDTSFGDDNKASIDKATRDALAARVADILAQPGIDRLPESQLIKLERLKGILISIEYMPGGYYLQSTNDFLKGQIHGQEECLACMDEDPGMLCSQCKAVRFCGKECQLKAWRSGHKNRCWVMVE
ncbi:hypothetical protein DICSQDRAFT_77218 [Dichomitus squalens LYAD-421 SS1]|uniref:uncharacterized protein n=1 Tax=Dichomitus squalens (strain LYAD-421) TaxID=732165 RepID=UPI000441180C|nr:uncharacterized protein DICSQDRAFT_77218 [Dichomitus squalens LYAD-421 SS1]EJF67482.1 hypothetical protein DICSQDRAFT_77218 [Dichomitus squalens LYAD-421 SS1]